MVRDGLPLVDPRCDSLCGCVTLCGSKLKFICRALRLNGGQLTVLHSLFSSQFVITRTLYIRLAELNPSTRPRANETTTTVIKSVSQSLPRSSGLCQSSAVLVRRSLKRFSGGVHIQASQSRRRQQQVHLLHRRVPAECDVATGRQGIIYYYYFIYSGGHSAHSERCGSGTGSARRDRVVN